MPVFLIMRRGYTGFSVTHGLVDFIFFNYLRYDTNWDAMKKKIKKLTLRDAVLGIGRKATSTELAEYLNRPRKEEFKPIAQVRQEITEHLRRRNQNRKAS
jgi:hypothetical protein